MRRVSTASAVLLAVTSLGTAAESADAAAEFLDELSLLQTILDQRPANALQTQLVKKPVPGIQPPDTFHRDYTSDGTGAAAASPAAAAAPAAQGSSFSMRKVMAEYVAMTLFVVVGCGTACAIAKEEGSAWVLQVALAFGFAITALAYSLGRYSGGQINCAVTLALWVNGALGWQQALVNFIGQMLGSITGAIILCIMFPIGRDKTTNLGSNGISPGFGYFGVLVGEFLMTLLLVIVVLESGKVPDPASGIAVIPIGLAVFLAHCVLIPMDGCSINPTRSFGPAVMAMLRNGKADTLADMWVFWAGPLLGALAGVGVHTLFQT